MDNQVICMVSVQEVKGHDLNHQVLHRSIYINIDQCGSLYMYKKYISELLPSTITDIFAISAGVKS